MKNITKQIFRIRELMSLNESINNKNIKIKKIETDNDKKGVINVAKIVFSEQMNPDDISKYLEEVTSWINSYVVYDKDKVIGFYLLGNKQIYDFISEFNTGNKNYKDYLSKKGVEGVALGLLPEYRNLGIGRELRKIPLTSDFDYIWGQHYKSLHNVDMWKKFGRTVVYDGIIDGDDLFVTLMDIK